MDSTSTSSITDDQELAKVLESMNTQASIPAVPPIGSTDELKSAETAQALGDDLSFEDTALPSPDQPSDVTPVVAPEPVVEPTPVATPDLSPLEGASSSPELDSIKKTALEELRPLVDKLDLPADEKFDTLLLIIRSTDDKTLVGAAHEAARGIVDETKRAQALLDVIKEIDYFSGHGQQPSL